MERLLHVARKLIPAPIFRALQPPYHFTMALLGALLYRFPSRELYVIGVTGTKGKTTTSEIINTILEASGEKTALANTIRFKIGSASHPNLFKMTMPGRFFLERFLRRAVERHTRYVILEMTSEGVKQFRHKFIYLNALIFTNLTPEHIEAHGSFEKYVQAKFELARALERSPKKETVIVANADDEYGKKFLEAKVIYKLPYSEKDAVPYKIKEKSTEITIAKNNIEMPLVGIFNIYNALAAITFAKHLGIEPITIARALKTLEAVKGRVEYIEEGQPFSVIVDYAHTPDSLEKLYRAFEGKDLICVLGNTGGGRDKWKRPRMGAIAERYCRSVILTNEDPYDEDPKVIADEMAKGMKKRPEIIMDRREAIRKALKKAFALRPIRLTQGRPEELEGRQAQGNEYRNIAVLITGKGTDPYIMGPDSKKTPWSDADVAREETRALLQRQP